MRAAIVTQIVVAALLCTRGAYATAGFAETHSRLEYGSLASLQWVHPGDGCDRGRYCFFLERSGAPARGFRGIAFSLAQINAPAEEDRGLIFAQRSDGGWLVYDLRAEEFLAQPGSFERAAQAWRAAGLTEPRFAEAEHGARGLSRTWASRFEDLTWLALMWLPALLLLALPLGTLGFVIFLVRYRRQRKPLQLVWGFLFLLLSLPAWLLFGRVLVSMIQYRGR